MHWNALSEQKSSVLHCSLEHSVAIGGSEFHECLTATHAVQW